MPRLSKSSASSCCSRARRGWSSGQVRDVDGIDARSLYAAARRTCSYSCRATARSRTAMRRRSASVPTRGKRRDVHARLRGRRSTRRAARSHGDQFRYRDMPAVIDADGAIARRAKATVTPQAVVVDRAGGKVPRPHRQTIRRARQATPRGHRARLGDAIAAVIAGRPIVQAETEAVGCFIPQGTVMNTRTLRNEAS